MDNKPHLLIVDDEPLNRELLRRMLGAKYALSEAGDVTEAIAVLESEVGSVHLVLCDYLMPGRNGVELAGIIRERWPSTLFMLLTGYEEDEIIARAQEQGLVQAVVTKPWRSTELRSIIASALGETV